MSASFSQCWIQAKEPLRQELADDYQRFLASGRKPIVGQPQASAYDFTKKKSQKALNSERRERLGIDKKPKTNPIRTVAYVHKRMKNRSATSDRS